jgi:outer membrane receptor for ferrienterochelin and colicin
VFFWREISDHIVFLQATARTSVFANIFNARSVGGELGLKLASPGERLRLGLNGTYQHYINTSTDGLYRDQAGDRIPNRPYLFANANASYLLPRVSNEKKRFSLFADARYVGDYFLGWESIGSRTNKQVIPAQFSVNTGLTCELNVKSKQVVLTGEVFNLFNARIYDFFATQRPGRSAFVKATYRF